MVSRIFSVNEFMKGLLSEACDQQLVVSGARINVALYCAPDGLNLLSSSVSSTAAGS